MCGIIGTASVRPIDSRDWLDAGRDAMVHRGPDDAGAWWSPDGRVGLGFRRLAILDLSQLGHQPMQSVSGGLTIVFNGEIYNFAELREELEAGGATFRSRSDTEVLLGAYAAWGEQCLTRLNGMFALAVYDAARQRVLLARDRAGKKPLFYTVRNGQLRFASELKGLMADPALPRQIDPEALDCYLAMGYAPGERCILKGVRKLPPGQAAVFELTSGELKAWQYWQLPPQSAGQLDATALEQELETLLEASVRQRLVADVPVGIMLSGGVDSSLITAMAVRAHPTVRTFTVRFPDSPKHDETEHARLIAGHFGTDHHELEAGTSSVDLLPTLARQFDEPIVDSSMVPMFLVSRSIRSQCTVALGGDGGDELFGGYSAYDRLLRLHQIAAPIPRTVRRPVSAVARSVLPVGTKGRNWIQAASADFEQDVPMFAVYFDQAARRSLMASVAAWKTVAEQIHAERTPSGVDLLDRATRMDFENYLPEDILVKVDRASMLASLEVRAPLLDVRIIEFAFGRVPSTLKAAAGSRKILLKRLASRVLPPAFDQRRKQGFEIPLDRWLRSGPWHQFFRDVLLDPRQALFETRYVERLLDAQRNGRANGERLFALVMFELWRREYGVAA